MSLITPDKPTDAQELPPAAKLFLVAQQAAMLRQLLNELFHGAEWLSDGGLLLPGEPDGKRAVDLFAMPMQSIERH